jgi:drebrin-like protein
MIYFFPLKHKFTLICFKGTKYEKQNPAKEINAKERDKFWEKEEQEEKKRQGDEKMKKDVESRKIEEERIKQEVTEDKQK